DWAVPRLRIATIMAESTRAPLTMVTGPPGAGKTMAIALWAATRASRGPCAWMTVDDYDNRPRVFWSYVTAALRAAGVQVVPLSPAMASGNDVDHGFLLRLASDLAGQDPPVTLVLDDLHLLTGPAALDGLAYVLRNAAPGLRLIAASRMDPLLPLHRYRLAGELAEVRAGDLAFSVAESALLLAQHGIVLPDPAIESLTRRAEGWAAGLRLAAISLEGHPDPAQFVKEFAVEDSSITGYLVDEVLDAQPPPVRDLLLRTSILTQVSADVANVLTDDADAARTLSELARTNAFVRSVGHGCYRYHALFGSVLRLKLRRESPGLVRELHRRAAEWYWRNGSLGEAVRHAAGSGDWPFAARIVIDELAIGQLIEPRGPQPVTDEFRRMPPGAEPEVLLVAAAMELARSDGEPDGTALGAADAILEHRPAGGDVPARLAAALVRVALSRRTGDHAAAAGAVARAEELLEDIPAAQLARHPGVRIEVLSGRGMAELWAGDFDQAADTLRAAIEAAAPGSSVERIDCLGNLALAEALGGHLTRAGGLADEAITGQSAGPAAPVALACVHLDRGEFREARTQLKLAEEALHLRPDPLTDALARSVAVRYALAEGHARPARGMLGRARAAWPLPGWLDRRMVLLESGACAAGGAIQDAVAAAESAAPRSHLDAAVVLAQTWLAAGNPEAARRALGAPRAGADEAPDYTRVEAWLVDARLSYRADDRARGYLSLEQALRLGSAEQLRLPFIVGRAWIRPVLRQDPRLARAYQSLLKPTVIGPSQVLAPPPGDAAPLIVEQLSQREREVIQHVSAMMSTAEIAAEMYISVNTVKTHLKSIHRNLSADHRRDAVRRARQLHLV
ncbi:MAG: LuxR C-terminal-related transcriptional regulator, partial [Streptosporangiaceae bacterium]